MRELRRRQLGFADLELWRQGVRLDPLLEQIGRFLEQHGELIQLVYADLVRGLKKHQRCRAGLTAEQVLRAFVLQRAKNWDYRELRERIADSFTRRQFTRFDGSRVPKHDVFQRAFVQLTPHTLRQINDAVIAAAVRLGIEDGRQLRVDSTVVETDIRYPRDSGLLWDSVRVTRLVGGAARARPRRRSGIPRPDSPRQAAHAGDRPHARARAAEARAPAQVPRPDPGDGRGGRSGRRGRAARQMASSPRRC